jgi:hypothetical protein
MIEGMTREVEATLHAHVEELDTKIPGRDTE